MRSSYPNMTVIRKQAADHRGNLCIVHVFRDPSTQTYVGVIRWGLRTRMMNRSQAQPVRATGEGNTVNIAVKRAIQNWNRGQCGPTSVSSSGPPSPASGSGPKDLRM